MPLLFFLAGLVLIVTGINGTVQDAGALLKKDFTGPGNFFAWFFAILFAGALGYIPTLKPISYGFLVLVFVGILLSSGSGFFVRLRETAEELTRGNALGSSGGGANYDDITDFFSGFIGDGSDNSDTTLDVSQAWDQLYATDSI
jgi:hypothetical protein